MARALLALVLFASAPALAAPFGPFRTREAPVTRDAKARVAPTEQLPSADPFWFAFKVYQATLSSQDGARCAHAPTCSLYGVQAVRRHRVLGFFFTVDRMWKQGRSSELRPLPKLYGGAFTRFYDPVDAADFWLRGIDDTHAPEYAPPRPRQ